MRKVEALYAPKEANPHSTNVSINEITAHYPPTWRDKNIIPENSVVKVDLGVQIDSYVTGTAFTACFNPRLTK